MPLWLLTTLQPSYTVRHPCNISNIPLPSAQTCKGICQQSHTWHKKSALSPINILCSWRSKNWQITPSTRRQSGGELFVFLLWHGFVVAPQNNVQRSFLNFVTCNGPKWEEVGSFGEHKTRKALQVKPKSQFVPWPERITGAVPGHWRRESWMTFTK